MHNFSAVPVMLRLRGFSKNAGRVEVLYDGQWGTICDDGWDINDARVVCRQLGFSDAIRPLFGSQVPPGSGRIWLNGVSCTGREENITKCSHNGWKYHNNHCKHSQDAGVECSTSGIVFRSLQKD